MAMFNSYVSLPEGNQSNHHVMIHAIHAPKNIKQL